MNFALPAILVFVVLLPGFLARSRIKRVERTTLDYSPFGQIVTEAVLWAMALHALWIGALTALTPWRFRPDVALRLLSAEPAAQTQALAAVAAQAAPVALYFATLLAFATLAPTAFRRWVSHRRWDRLGSPLAGMLRFSSAPWYYLLSGADFPAEDEPDVISVSAIVDVAGQPWLYVGLLEDYYLNPDGELDRLILHTVMRRPLSEDKKEAPQLERFYPIDGDYFVLRYAEAVTLNIEYIQLRDAPADTATEAAPA